MRTIYLVLTTAVALLALLLAAVAALRAQGQQPALVGMPEYGALAIGCPVVPVIVNRSGEPLSASVLPLRAGPPRNRVKVMKSLISRRGDAHDADASSEHSWHRGSQVLTIPIFDVPADDPALPVLEDAEQHP
jgi:hypothetical protein